MSDSPDGRVPCPHCSEPVQPAAAKCHWCMEWIDASSSEVVALMTLDADLPDPRDTGAPIDDHDPRPEISDGMLRIEPLVLELGSDLVRLAEPGPGTDGPLIGMLKDARRRIALEFGVVAPGVRVRPRPALAPGEYCIVLRGNPIATGAVRVDEVLCIGPDLDAPGIDAVPTIDPIYRSPAAWVPSSEQARADEHGLLTFDAGLVVATHLAECVKAHLHELLSREEVSDILRRARRDSPVVVQELVPAMLTLGQLRHVLQGLVREQVPIRDLETILDALADRAMYARDASLLVEHARVTLARTLSNRAAADDGVIRAFRLTDEVERAIAGAIHMTERGNELHLDHAARERIVRRFEEVSDTFDPVVLVSPGIRPFVWALLAPHVPKVQVLSHAEIAPGFRVETIAFVDGGDQVDPALQATCDALRAVSHDLALAIAEHEAKDSEEAAGWGW